MADEVNEELFSPMIPQEEVCPWCDGVLSKCPLCYGKRIPIELRVAYILMSSGNKYFGLSEAKCEQLRRNFDLPVNKDWE